MDRYDSKKPDLNRLYDLVIIGGGINGAGIALDAALRGLSVVLLEKDDFGSHTTSASTKLIHGGLRYLEYFEFSLVRESLRERERLLKNAPHLSWPLKLNVPVYEHSKRGPLTIKAGMVLYDLLSFDKSLPKHTFHYISKNGNNGFDKSCINKKGLKAMASYYDCQVGYPERLCMEVVLSARKEGAVTLNYHEVQTVKDDPEGKSIVVFDKLGNREFAVKSRMVVNAGGVFVDKINARISGDMPQKIGGTKGSHILIKKFEYGPKEAFYVEAVQDGRPFFIIPWRDFYLVGTTDIYYDGDLDRIAATEKEVEYLLYELNNLFPDNNFGKEDVVYSYSGVRPLPYEPGKRENQVTRSHIVFDHSKYNGQTNLISIIGGKLTTYRSLAEECVDIVCSKLSINEKCKTQNYHLIGSEDYESNEADINNLAVSYASKYDIKVESVKHLIKFYGSRFKNVLTLVENDPILKEQICAETPDIFAQIVYAILFEQARSLNDIMMRRTAIGTSESLGLNCTERVAESAAKYLNWTKETAEEEINNYKTYIYQNHKNYLNN